jgi:hypothetical protein
MRVLAIALTAVLIVLSVVAIVGGFALLARRRDIVAIGTSPHNQSGRQACGVTPAPPSR